MHSPLLNELVTKDLITERHRNAEQKRVRHEFRTAHQNHTGFLTRALEWIQVRRHDAIRQTSELPRRTTQVLKIVTQDIVAIEENYAL